MEEQPNPGASLESRLEQLRSIDAADSAQRVLREIRVRERWQQRQVIGASCGVAVSAIGTVNFLLRGDYVIAFALALAASVFAYAALRSARAAATLGEVRSGASLLAGWRAELVRHVRQSRMAPFAAGLFIALTAWVVRLHGVASWKSVVYLAVAVIVSTFAAYQYLVIRPSLERELAVLDRDG